MLKVNSQQLIVITLILAAGLFSIPIWPVEAEVIPPGYFKYGDFYCNSNTDFEKPASAGVWPLAVKFCQPQATGCQIAGGKFCAAGTRNSCCLANNECGKGTAYGHEVAICVPPTSPSCNQKSPGYAGTTKEGKNICCRSGYEPGPAGGLKAPYCQPKNQSVCVLGEKFIQGIGAYQKEKRCCAINTTPARHPNGLPFCALNPPKPKANLPAVGVISPKEGESISGLFQIRVALSPQPSDPITKIQLFIDNKFERQSFFPILRRPWVVGLSTWKLSPGSHTLKLIATSRTNQMAIAERRVNIVADTTPPVIEFLEPLADETTLPIIAGNVFVRISVKDQNGIGAVYICVNDQCSIPICIPGKNQKICSLTIPVSQLINQTTKIVGIAYDEAWDPNRGAVGLEFPPPLKIDTNPADTGWVRFNI